MHLGNIERAFEFSDPSDTEGDDRSFQVNYFPTAPPMPTVRNQAGRNLVPGTHINEEIKGLLQKQQGMLQNVLDGQEELRNKHSQLEAKVTLLERELKSQAQDSLSSSDTNGKRKRIVTRELSVRFLNTHLLGL